MPPACWRCRYCPAAFGGPRSLTDHYIALHQPPKKAIKLRLVIMEATAMGSLEVTVTVKDVMPRETFDDTKGTAREIAEKKLKEVQQLINGDPNSGVHISFGYVRITGFSKVE
jgi:hypothetical protein